MKNWLPAQDILLLQTARSREAILRDSLHPIYSLLTCVCQTSATARCQRAAGTTTTSPAPLLPGGAEQPGRLFRKDGDWIRRCFVCLVFHRMTKYLSLWLFTWLMVSRKGLEMQVNAGIQEEFGHNYYCLVHIFLELRQQTLRIGTALYFISKGDFARHFVAMNCDLMKMEILFFISIL